MAVQNARKWGGLGWLGGTQGPRQCHQCPFRHIAGYLSKVADFDNPTCIQRPRRGVTPIEFRGDLWHQKTRLPGVSCGVVCVILCFAVLVELRLVTDTDTDTDTDGHRPMASTADA